MGKEVLRKSKVVKIKRKKQKKNKRKLVKRKARCSKDLWGQNQTC